MGIFRQRFAIEFPFPVDEAWKRLLAATKTDQPTCAQCGRILAWGARFCSSCGQAAPPPQSWLRRPFSRGQGFEFEGDVSPQGFRMSRIISYRNSCIPIVRGRFEPSSAGTRIVIEMKMHPLGWVLLVGGMGLSFLVPAIIAGANAPSSGVLLTVALVAPWFIGMICWVAFAVEASIARAAMSRIWESVPLSAAR